MKVILTEKITRLGNIGDVADVKTGYARNYLLPNGKALRHSRENLAVFESQKAALVAKHETAKKNAESQIDAVKNAKFHMIRTCGDTGQLYGSVSSRDIARMLKELTGIDIQSAQVLMGSPIKMIGSFDTKIALHPDVIVPVKIYVAPTSDEIDALVAGKILTFGTKKVEEDGGNEGDVGAHRDAPADGESTENISEEKSEKKPPFAKATGDKPRGRAKKTDDVGANENSPVSEEKTEAKPEKKSPSAKATGDKPRAKKKVEE
ncbi:MAG: 50S ribosomal protein L9 [Proteobacteria bacterium]|nr:50S ribosomal protein L9 [Pseudomonadota bacterium]